MNHEVVPGAGLEPANPKAGAFETPVSTISPSGQDGRRRWPMKNHQCAFAAYYLGAQGLAAPHGFAGAHGLAGVAEP